MGGTHERDSNAAVVCAERNVGVTVSTALRARPVIVTLRDSDRHSVERVDFVILHGIYNTCRSASVRDLDVMVETECSRRGLRFFQHWASVGRMLDTVVLLS